jgi:hypothetical protein
MEISGLKAIFPDVFRDFLCENARRWKSLEGGGSGEKVPRAGTEISI